METRKSKNKYSFSIFLLSLISYLLFPNISFAFTYNSCGNQGIQNLICSLTALIVQAIPIIFALALLYFFYGIAIYVSRAGNEKSAKEGKSIMIYGVIALFVMFSIWGIITFLGTNLGLTQQSNITDIKSKFPPLKGQ